MATKKIFSFSLFNKVLGKLMYSSDMWEVKQTFKDGEIHTWSQWFFLGSVSTPDEKFGELKCFNATFLWFAISVAVV